MRYRPLIAGLGLEVIGAFGFVSAFLGNADLLHSLTDGQAWIHAYGFLIAGTALIVWGVLPSATRSAGEVKPPEAPMGNDNRRGFFNEASNFGSQVYNEEDQGPLRRMRDLFNTIDPRVNRLSGDHVVRMEPYHLEALAALIKEAGAESPVRIVGILGTLKHSIIQNGSLGVSYAADIQHPVHLSISRPLA